MTGEQEQHGINLLSYWDIVWRRKWLILPVMGVVMAVCLYNISRIRPIYGATARLMIQTGNETDLFGSQQVMFWLPPPIQENCAILQSRPFAETVASQMDPGLRKKILGLHPGVDVAGFVQGSFSVEPAAEANLIIIHGRGPKPDIVTGLVNAVATIARDYDLGQRRQKIDAVLSFIDQQLGIIGERLKRDEDELQRFKETRKIVSVEQQATTMATQLSNLKVMREQNKTDLDMSEKRLAYLNGLLEQAQAGLPQRLSGMSSPVIGSLKRALDELEVKRMNLIVQGVGEQTPAVAALDAQIREYRDKIKSQLASLTSQIAQGGAVDVMGRLQSILESVFTLTLDLEGFRAKEKVLDERERAFDQELMQLPTEQRTFVQLSRNVEADQKLYVLLSERGEEAKIVQAGRLSNIKIVDFALNASQEQARKKTMLIMGLLLGIFLFVGLCVILEYLDPSVKDRRDFERISNLPVFAVIPDLRTRPGLGWLRLLRKDEPLQTHLLTHTDPKASGAEMFRMLRTNLEYASVEPPLRLLVVTSAGPQEGKSTVAVNLAVALAQSGVKTLIIDSDLRRPTLHEVFNTDKRPGLTDLVLGGKDAAGAIRTTAVENLNFLPCGTIPPSPADFLDSKAVDAAFARFMHEYRYVIADGAPLLAVADTAIIASKVQGAILVVRVEKTAKPALREAIKILSGAKVKVVGAVINGVRYHGRHYGTNYYYYYSSKKR